MNIEKALQYALPKYVAEKYPHLKYWNIELFTSMHPGMDAELVTLTARDPISDQIYRASKAFTRAQITTTGNLMDIYIHTLQSLLADMHYQVMRKEADRAGVNNDLMKVLQILL